MEQKIVKLCAIALLFLILGSSCEQDSWIEVTLSNTTCNKNLKTVENLAQIKGTISSIPDIANNPDYIRVEDSENESEFVYYFPCNLPDKFKEEGLQIIFNGDLKEIQDVVDTISSPITIAQSITLTSLKTKCNE